MWPSRSITRNNAKRLPENIALIEAENSLDAYRESDRALRTRPFNAAVWNGLAERTLPSTSGLVRDITHFMMDGEYRRQRRTRVGIFNSKAEAQTILSDYFNTLEEKTRTAKILLRRHDGEQEMQQLRANVESMVLPIFDLKDDVVVDFQICELRETRRHVHFDRGDSTTLPDWKEQLFLGKPVKVVMNLNGSGTGIFNNKDVDQEKSFTVTDHPGIYGYNHHDDPALWVRPWQTRTWAITVLASEYWPHYPALHCSVPMRLPGQSRAVAMAKITPTELAPLL